MYGKKEKAPVWQKDWCCEPVDLGLPYYTTNALKFPDLTPFFRPLTRSPIEIGL